MKELLRNDWRSIVFWIAVLAGVVVVVYWAQTVFPTLQPGDKGTWAGAIGTFFTLVGTIILATGESRRRYRAEKALAQLACCSLYARQIRAQAAVDIVIDELSKIRLGPVISGKWEICHNKLREMRLWTIDELVPIATLPQSAAKALASATENLNYVQSEIQRYIDAPALDYGVELEQLIALLRGTQTSLREATRTCERAMHR